MEWTDLAEDRGQWRVLVSTVKNLWVRKNIEKFLSIWVTDWRVFKKSQLHGVS
jgi:hypothetical protein